MKEIMKNSTLLFLLITAVYIGGVGIAQVLNSSDTATETYSVIDQEEIDSVDNYMRYWYEVLDTNSDGEIDDTAIEWLEE